MCKFFKETAIKIFAHLITTYGGNSRHYHELAKQNKHGIDKIVCKGFNYGFSGSWNQFYSWAINE